MRTPIDPIVRFYHLTERQGSCLIWKGTKARGYGYFQASTNQQVNKVRCNRWIYEQEVGPIPEGYDVDHVKERGCVGKECVEWRHLEAVPHKENMRRARLAVCKTGKHDLTDPNNVRWDAQGNRRGCKPCKQESALRHYHEHKES